MFFYSRVAENSSKNLMAASNLGVVFGPTLMKSKEESMAAIMNLKYQSVVIELLIKEFSMVSVERVAKQINTERAHKENRILGSGILFIRWTFEQNSWTS